MVRFILSLVPVLFCTIVGAQNIVSYGLFVGGVIPFTYDEGINKDPRYSPRYDVKFSPIGFHYGVDYDGYGFLISPSIITTGQNFNVINTVGGEVGTHKIDMLYLNVPLSLKIHMIDLSFFRVSFVASGAVAYLINGQETISHAYSKLRFAPEVIPILPPDYIVQYDGVQSPEVHNYSMLSNSDFKPFQVNVAAGFRSDWQVSEKLSISFDLRANYGVFDPRNNTYLQKVNSYQALYALPGNRRDIFVYLTVGVSRYIEIDKKEKERKRIKKGSPKAFSPSNYRWAKPRNTNPKR